MKLSSNVTAFACVLACMIPARAFAVETMPFTDSPNGGIAVQASVDGRPPLPMLVDLGAGLDLLSANAGRSLVSVTGKYVTLRLTGQRADIPYGTVLSLAVGPVKLDAPAVGIWSGLDGTGVDGLIAATSFAGIATTFDYKAHQLVVEDATTFPDRKRTGSRVPLIVRDDIGVALDLFARFDVGNGKTALCDISTGSQTIAFDSSLAPELGVDLSNPSLRHVKTPWGDGIAATIPTLALPGASQSAMTRVPVVFADLLHDCSVGNAFWAPRGFTLSIPERAIYIPGG